MVTTHIIDEKKIYNTLIDNETNAQKNSRILRARVHDILDKAKELHGLTLEETMSLLVVTDQESLEEIFAAACQVKDAIYGSRIVIFAPLYISNLCSNDCLYCAFRATNKTLKRRALTQQEIIAETKALLKQGHKRLVLVAGETYPNNDLNYIYEAIKNIYATKLDNDATQNTNPATIRRINVNLAPLSIEKFRELKDCNIGTYQLFQETYHRDTYKKVHLTGKKADYEWRLTAMDRAIQAGIDDVGIGALFGLSDWHFEVLALLQHSAYLQQEYGAGPHTISVPRLEPALGSELASHPLYPISDNDFCKIVAILRLAVPYTGIIMSTRENPALRRLTFKLGVSQISAGSRTNPGGYLEDTALEASQFSLGDHRTLDEVVQDIATLGYIPSFCTACYRSGRTGEDFMHLAQPGLIKNMCHPNALLTFKEYLLDHASVETRTIGEKFIQQELAELSLPKRNTVTKLLNNLNIGKRDLFV